MNEQPAENQPNAEEAIISAIKRKKDALYGIKGKVMEIGYKLQDIGARLKEKYDNAEEYYLYHVLIGSTMDRDKCTKFDFPREYSVVVQLETLYREYIKGE